MGGTSRLRSISARLWRLVLADADLALRRRRCSKVLSAAAFVALLAALLAVWILWSVFHGAGRQVEHEMELIGAPRELAAAAVNAMVEVADRANPKPAFRVILLCLDPNVDLPAVLRTLQTGLDAALDHRQGPTALDLWELADVPAIGDALVREPWLLGPATQHAALPLTASPLLWAQSWNIAPDQDNDRALILESTAIITPRLYQFMKEAVSLYSTAPFLAGYGLVETAPNNYKNPTEPFLYTGPFEAKAFVPGSSETWRAFQEWMADHRHEIGFWPYAARSRKRDDPLWDNFRGSREAHWALWFTRFCDESRLQVLLPGDSLALFLPPVIDSIPVVAFDGTQNRHSSFLQAENLQKILNFSRANQNWVSVTVVTQAFLETALSWLCNVDTLGIRPPAIVWLCADDDSYNGLDSIPGTEAFRLDEFSPKHSRGGAAYGTKEYWGLMLERTHLIGDLLDHKIHVFAFETDQVWFANPMPYMRPGTVPDSAIDVIGAMDSKREIGGNLLLLNPTLSTRRLWRKVVSLFKLAYSEGASNKADGFRYIANDQSLLSRLILYDEDFRSTNPIRYESLSIDLFADGTWYGDHEPGSLTLRNNLPIIVNNNFIRGVSEKTKRLRKYNHWFRDGHSCDAPKVRAMVDGVTFASLPGPASLDDFVEGIKGRFVKSDTRTKKFKVSPSRSRSKGSKEKKSSKSGHDKEKA